VAEKDIWYGVQDKLFQHYKEVGADDGFKLHEAALLRLTPFVNQKDGSPTSIVSFMPTETSRSFSDFVQAFGADSRKGGKKKAKLVANGGVERMDQVVDLNRNVTLTTEAGKLRRYGWSEDEILAGLLQLNQNRCQPPLPESEVERIAKSVARYAPDEDIVIIDDATAKSLTVSFGRFRRIAFGRVEPIVFGLRPGQLGIVQAVPNVGKSTLMLNLAASAAVGRSFEPLYEGGTPRKVLFLDFENTGSFLQEDLVRMAESFDDDEQALLDENLIIVVDKFIGDEPLDLSIEAHYEAVLRQAVDREVEIIVVDTLAEGLSMQNENDNSEMKRVVITPMKKLGKQTGAAVLLVHHIGKASEGKHNESLYRGRGASSLPGAARLILNLEHLKDAHGNKVKDHVKLQCAKVKGRMFENRILRLNFEARWFETTDVDVGVREATQDLMLKLVREPLKRAGLIALGKEAGLDVSDRTVERTLKYGTQVGLLRKVGQTYHPTSLLLKRLGEHSSGLVEVGEGEPATNEGKVLRFRSKPESKKGKENKSENVENVKREKAA
jgi:hypothetical protein